MAESIMPMNISRALNITVWSILALLIGSTVLVILYTPIILRWFDGHPSDDKIIASLEQHREKYEELIDMVEGDPRHWSVSQTSREPQDQISDDRWEAYKHLFDELNIHSTTKRSDGGILFNVSYSKGSSKNLVYRPESPQPLFDSLDQEPPQLEPNAHAYRRIDDDWYIFQWWGGR